MTSFFVDVRCHPLQPNEISYNSAIHACGRGGQWELALSLLKEMRELGLSPDRISFGAMVSLGLWLSVSRESRLTTAASPWVKSHSPPRSEKYLAWSRSLSSRDCTTLSTPGWCQAGRIELISRGATWVSGAPDPPRTSTKWGLGLVGEQSRDLFTDLYVKQS